MLKDTCKKKYTWYHYGTKISQLLTAAEQQVLVVEVVEVVVIMAQETWGLMLLSQHRTYSNCKKINIFIIMIPAGRELNQN